MSLPRPQWLTKEPRAVRARRRRQRGQPARRRQRSPRLQQHQQQPRQWLYRQRKQEILRSPGFFGVRTGHTLLELMRNLRGGDRVRSRFRCPANLAERRPMPSSICSARGPAGGSALFNVLYDALLGVFFDQSYTANIKFSEALFKGPRAHAFVGLRRRRRRRRR
jgi:hypothetical protein